MSIKRGLAYVLIANAINLLIGLVNSFFLPKYLSYESYAMIKTYTLYMAYVGCLHLGYLDGMYLRYGGKDISAIDKDDIGTEHKNILFMQVAVSAIVFCISLTQHSAVLYMFSIGLLLNNLISFYQMLFQATGCFKLYSRALNYSKITEFVLNMSLLFLLCVDNYVLYIGNHILAMTLVLSYLAFSLSKKTAYFRSGHLDFNRFKENISTGFILMLGNLSNNFFTALDRWFVKILMTAKDFSIYSFAVSIDSLITIFVTPLSITLYNALCQNSEAEYIRRMKRIILIWGFMIIVPAFAAKWILEHFMVKYVDSGELIFLLFATQAIYSVIKGVYVNLYKAQKKQNEYLRQMILMTVISFLLNVLLFSFLGSRVSLAIGTLLTAFIWLIICEFKNPEIRFSKKEWVAFGIEMTTYITCGAILSPVVGLFVYSIVSATVLLLLLRDDFLFMVSSAKEFVLKRKL